MTPVIQVNEEGRKLITALCDASLKKEGLQAFTATTLVLTNMRLIPPQGKPKEPENKEK